MSIFTLCVFECVCVCVCGGGGGGGGPCACVRVYACVWSGEVKGGWVGGGNNYTFKEELPSESRTSVNQTLTFAK